MLPRGSQNLTAYSVTERYEQGMNHA